MSIVRTLCSAFLRRRSAGSLSAANDTDLLLNSTKAHDVDPNKLEDEQPVHEFIRNKQYAVLLCYHGENYLGLQFNDNGPTIESHLFAALIRAGFVSKSDYKESRYKLRYTRASRTDSGVSALRQTISLSLPREFNADELNAHLPYDVRAVGSIRVTKSFDAQKWCDHRSYCYIMPSFALCNWMNESKIRVSYRADAYTLSMTNEIFKVFEGTHRFHNYTVKRDMWDKRSVRSVLSASISNVFLYGDLEMVAFHIKGKSFMLHQIRRMIGMTIAIMRGRATPDFIQNSFENPLLPAPTAPSLGLILEKQYFDNYNRLHKKMPPLVWDEYDSEVEKFKHEVVVPRIVEVELKENSYPLTSTNFQPVFTVSKFLRVSLTQASMENYLRDVKKHSFTKHPESSKLTTLGEWKGLELDEEDVKIIAKYQK
ncbi:tRNA pseudouridine synthase A [Frankliniella fusca]|uniref:Pseudouridylate synthase 1 homolog n=1 Tax=Frankliniella fusca TaxID=407009 RepID=A0AAE1LGM6_9NEOP|nr:tRNA pseudouridine synthase A [Frankliniella fusca]